LAQLLAQNTPITYADYLNAALADDAGGSLQVRSVGSSFYERLKKSTKIAIKKEEKKFNDTGQTVATFVVTIVDDCVQAVLRTIDDVIDYVGALFARLGALALDMIHFIESVIYWPDIKQTAAVIVKVLEQVPGVIKIVF